ncbi:MAG: RND family efflux transporter MFP subunit [Akkermansiaceae bacterium]|jgi:RND family efflux transporter MFP subunit
MSRLLRFLLPLIVLAIGYFGYQRLSIEDEKPPPPRPPKKIIEAQATLLKKIDYRVTLESQGIVQPHNQTSLTPRVSGRIIHISPNFESGSFFAKNDILIELDSADFIAARTTVEARLARSEASLAQEEARAEQALLDWEDLGYTTPPTELVLRKPQLKEARANVKAAQAELSEALRNLDRAKVRAPYAGRVKERLVGLGQSVSTGTTIGEIFSTDFAEVRLSLSARELIHVKLPNNPEDAPIPVTLNDALTDASTQSWQGSIVRTEGTLDEKSRKLFVIARVNDPFGLKTKVAAPLRIGQPVRAILEGGLIPGVFVIPRETLRRPGQILLINPEDLTLKRQDITPIWSDPKNLIVNEDLIEGWHLVTNRLATSANGVKVVIVEPEEEEPKSASTDKAKPAA